MKALKTCTWNCNNNKYSLVQGQEVDVKSADLEQAKASGLFDNSTIVKKTTRRKKED